MAAANYYKDITHVVHLRTDVGKPCEHCTKFFEPDRLAESVNHYIREHGYKVLHVGAGNEPR